MIDCRPCVVTKWFHSPPSLEEQLEIKPISFCSLHIRVILFSVAALHVLEYAPSQGRDPGAQVGGHRGALLEETKTKCLAIVSKVFLFKNEMF